MNKKNIFWSACIMSLLICMLLCSCNMNEEQILNSEALSSLEETEVESETPSNNVTSVEQISDSMETTDVQENVENDVTIEDKTEVEKNTENNQYTEEVIVDLTTMSQEQLIDLFNTASDDVKNDSSAITKNYTKLVVDQEEMDFAGSEFLKSMASSSISSNIEKGNESTRTALTLQEKQEIYPVRGEEWSSKLTDTMIESINCVSNDNTYELTIEIVDDNYINPNAGEGNAGCCLPIVYLSEVQDGSGNAGSIEQTFTQGKIKCTFDKVTGRIIASNYKMCVNLSMEYFGMDIYVPYTMECDYSIDEYSCAMKSQFRRSGNHKTGTGNHPITYASLLA